MNLLRTINPTYQDISEYIPLSDGKIAHRYNILCTNAVAYEVWEPSEGIGPNSHSTITTIEGKWYGSMTTRPLPPEIETLPGWMPGYWPAERIAAVDAYHKALEQEAEAIIKATWPQDFIG